jgi:opacity protein-like surface antigen
MNDTCKRLFVLTTILTLTVAAAGQETQRFESFGGYSLTHDQSFFPQATNFSGWDTSMTVFVNRWLGFTSDFSGHYASGTYPIPSPSGGPVLVRGSANSYTYLFGPHFTYRHKRYAPFAQTLFGIHNPHASFSSVNCPECLFDNESYSRFAMALGGGLDVNLGHGISLRPVQAEYLMLREPQIGFENGEAIYTGVNHNTFRYSAGVTFRFGQRLGTSK